MPMRGIMRGLIRAPIRRAAGGGGSRYLVSANYIDPVFSTVRAQVGTPGLSSSTSASGALRYHAANVTRFDGVLQELMSEAQDTNALLWSNDLGNAAWFVGQGGAKVGAAPAGSAPDGGNGAQEISFGADPAGYVAQAVGGGAGNYTFSMYLASKLATDVHRLGQFSPDTFTADLATTAAYQRFSMLSSAVDGANVSLRNRVAAFAGNVYAWGAMRTTRGILTSLIPTTTTAMTRGAETTSGPFAPIFPNAIGTIIFSFVRHALEYQGQDSVLGMNGGGKTVYLGRYPGINVLYQLQIGGGDSNPYILATTPGQRHTVGITFNAAGRWAAVANGGAVSAVNAPNASGLTTIFLAGDYGGTALQGRFGPCYTLPTVVSDAELTARVNAMQAL